MQILKDNEDEMTLIDFKSELFKTMGHPTRLRILELLRTGEKTVGELQQALDIDASSVSQQLAVMRTRQLVDARKQGTSVFYTVRDELVFQIMDIARQMFQNHVTNMQSILEDQDQLSEAGRSS
jgi:DNA-binding transcriptional ArsR family regulator